MTPERWQQIEDIFHEAAELEASERDAFLARACGSDLLLRQEVESLLMSREKPVPIIDAPLAGEAFRVIAVDRNVPLTGQIITRYKVLSRLGAGGMGEVYVAEDTQLGRKVVLKLLPTVFTRDPDQVRRFQQEARAASALNHPNIITIYEVGQADSLHFIAMEFIHGETLRQQLRSSHLTLRETLEIAIQVASALGAAHQAGIVHRDIKPENIMLRDDGYVKVLDFGIALLTEQQAPAPAYEAAALSPGKTEAQAVFGTASYMSPEQARGEPLDARTDLFSLGVVFYELVTGRRPFTGADHREVLHALLNKEPPPLRAFRAQVPHQLEAIINKALKKEREERYESASEMLDDLRRLKRQLELRAGEEPFYSAASAPSSAAGASKPVLPALRKAPPLRDIARRYANRILIAGLLAALAAGLDKLLLQPPTVWPVRDAALLVIALCCITVFIISRHRRVRLASSVYGEGPFRGLVPFQEKDRERFYGREDDTSSLLGMLTRQEFRFGVLYGDSGSGKTSLLTAGLVPGLKESGFLPLYCRSYKDPLAALVEECRKQTRMYPLDAEPPLTYLRRVAEELDTRLIILCDQFEEFFVNFRSKREREPFVALVADCYSAMDLPVKFLFSIRSDFLYLISSEFDGQIPEPLMGDKRYHLRNFDAEQAEEIITKSAESAHLPLEPALCRQVAHDLAAGETVLPSELQIVGAQLQRRRILSLQEYRRAGGKEQLVHSFVADVIRASGDQTVAQLLLRSLISDDNTRLTLSLKEIARRIKGSRETVKGILQLFVESRMIREIQEDIPWRYELMHEYLIEQINQLTGRVMNATQRANRQFRRYLSQYAIDPGTRIPLTKWWSINRYADIERSERERELLRKSLRWGLLKGSVAAVLLAGVATLAAAALSVREEWDGTRLSDGHTAAVRRAVFSPDGRRLVSVGEDSKVIVWDFEKRERLRTFTDHSGWVTTVAFSPDGKWFVTGSIDQTIIVWDAVRLEKTRVLREHYGQVTALAYSPDGQLLASSFYEAGDPTIRKGRIVVWEVNRWEKIREFSLGGDYCNYCNLLFSPDNRWLMSSYGGGWSVTTGQEMDRTSPTVGANWAAFSPTTPRMVGVDSGGNVTFWGLNQVGEPTRRNLSGRYHVHRDNGRSVAFSPDGRLVATAAEDIILWDAATQTRLARLEHTAIVWSVAFSPDGRWLVSSHGDGAILVWDVAERERIANLNEHSGSVRAVAYSPDGKRVASASEDQSIIIWDTEQWRKEAVLVGHQTRVTAVTFSPDGQWLASADQDGNLIYWNVATRQPRWTIHPTTGNLYSLAISPDGRWIATSEGVGETIEGHLIDFDHWINFEDRSKSQDFGGVYGVAFSGNGRWLACVSAAGWICLVDASNWQLIDRVTLSKTSLISVSFSPDGKSLVTGEDEGAVRLWTVRPLRPVALLGRHSARIKSVAFSPDGRRVASASDDQSISLWDVERRRLITNIGTHMAPVLSVAFSPNGRQLVSGEHDKSVRIYTRHYTLWGYQLN